MISSPKTPSSNANVANVTPQKVATNQRAVPLPYFSGRHWLPLVWACSNVYNPTPKAITQKVGKKTQTTGYDFFCDVFGLTSCCLNDFIEAIEVGGTIVWAAPGGISRDVDHPHHSGDIVVPNVATFRYHWGTPDAPRDFLILDTCGEQHPLYLKQSKLEVKQLYCGSNSQSVPTIRVLVERGARFAGLASDRTREGADAITTLAEVIGDDWFGLGRPELVDVPSWSALQAIVKREKTVEVPGDPTHLASMGYLSPYLERIQASQGFLAQILEHFDGWMRPKAGALEIGQFPHDGVMPGGLAELSYHDFIEAPEFAADDDTLGDVITDAVVSYKDRDNNMEDDSQPHANLTARDRLNDIREKSFQRPFIVTSYQAREQAVELAKFYSRPEEKCTVPIRRERIVGLRAGDRFILNDNPSQERRVVRIVERTDDSDGGRVMLHLVAERSLAPLGFSPAPQPQPTLPDPDLVAVVHARVFQFPAFGEYAGTPTVTMLAERPAAHVAGYTLHFSNDDATYDQIATIGLWALRGSLVAGIAAGDLTFTVAAAGFDLALLSPQSDAAAADDTLLLIIDGEICSIAAVVAVGGGHYTVTVLRGRRSSTAAGHAIAAETWIIPRTNLTILESSNFPIGVANRYFKLATYTDRGDGQDLAAALRLVFMFAATAVAGPTGLLLTSGNATVFIQPDGTAVVRLVANWTAPADPAVLAGGVIRVQYKTSAAPDWSDWAVIPADQVTVAILDVRAGVDYLVRIRAELADLTSAWATSALHHVVGDTTAPGVPSVVAAVAYPGYNEVSWTAPTDLDVNGYAVYRNTVNNSSTATLIGQTGDPFFEDPAVVPGTTYYYFIAAEDGSENLSAKSAAASVVASAAPVGDTTPADPAAATKTSDGNYTSGDGTSLAFFEMSVPALPAGATWQTVLFRRNIAADFAVVAVLKNAGVATVRIDNLAPGVAYQVATQAWAPGRASNIVAATGSPFTAQADPAQPATPTGGGFSTSQIPLAFFPGTQVRLFGTKVYWDKTTDKAFAYYELKVTFTDSDAAVDYSWSDYAGQSPMRFTSPERLIYNPLLSPGLARVRQVNRTGVASNWLRIGNANGSCILAGGSMSEQDSSNVSVSAVKTGDPGASSVRQVRTRFPLVDYVNTFAGGTPSENFTVSLSNRGFVTTPDVANLTCVDPAGDLLVAYDWSNGANSSTSIVFKAYTKDGSNISAGPRRFGGEVIEYN